LFVQGRGHDQRMVTVSKITFRIELKEIGIEYEIRCTLLPHRFLLYLQSQPNLKVEDLTKVEYEKRISEFVEASDAEWRADPDEEYQKDFMKLPSNVLAEWLKEIQLKSVSAVETKVTSEKK